MVSDNTVNTIKAVFPSAEIDQNHGEHSASVLVERINPQELRILEEKTSNWSGCVWNIEGDHRSLVKIVFEHIAFSAG